MDILKQRAIDRALKILDNMGCMYRVLNEHGHLLAVTIPHTAPDSDNRKRAPKRSLNVVMPYTKQVKAMAPGDSLTFNAPEGFTVSDVASCLSAAGSYYHGRQTCMTQIERDSGTVVILRVE